MDEVYIKLPSGDAGYLVISYSGRLTGTPLAGALRLRTKATSSQIAGSGSAKGGMAVPLMPSWIFANNCLSQERRTSQPFIRFGP